MRGAMWLLGWLMMGIKLNGRSDIGLNADVDRLLI